MKRSAVQTSLHDFWTSEKRSKMGGNPPASVDLTDDGSISASEEGPTPPPPAAHLPAASTLTDDLSELTTAATTTTPPATATDPLAAGRRRAQYLEQKGQKSHAQHGAAAAAAAPKPGVADRPHYRHACRHFLTGGCKNGTSCNHQHSLSAPRGPREGVMLINHVREVWEPIVKARLAHHLPSTALGMCQMIESFAVLTGSDDFAGLPDTQPGSEGGTNLRNLLAFYGEGGPLVQRHREVFFSEVLPFMARLVVDTDSILGSPVDFLPHRAETGCSTLQITELQVLALLCHCFFCLVPYRHKRSRHAQFCRTNTEKDYFDLVTRRYPNCNFTSLFIGGDAINNGWGAHSSLTSSHGSALGEGVSSVPEEKLFCLHHYFMQAHKKFAGAYPHRVDAMGMEALVFTRSSLASIDLPTWKESRSPLSHISVVPQGEAIEDATGCLQLDFANAVIGGGVLGRGCVQEEIRFLVSPQLLVSRLFCERMGDREGIKLFGARRFAQYTGYNDTFRFDKGNNDTTPVADFHGLRVPDISIAAADAINYTSRGKTPAMQYQTEEMKREMNKFFLAVSRTPHDPFRPQEVATGKWGCGVFKGDTELKALLQLMAVSHADIPIMRFYVYDDSALADRLTCISAAVAQKGCCVRDIYRALLSYSPKHCSPFEHVHRVLCGGPMPAA